MVNKMNDEIKKFWLKSKTIVVNLLTALFSAILLFWEDIGRILNENLPYLKSILTPNKMLIAFFILAIFNTYTRLKGNQAVSFRKKNCKGKKDE